MNPYNFTSNVRYSVFRKCTADHWTIEARTIPDHEFVLITGGNGVITIEGKSYTAKPGMLFYFYPDLVHSLKSSNIDPMIFYALHFVYARVDYACSQWTFEPCNNSLPIKPVNNIRAYQKLELLIKDLNMYWFNKIPNYEMMCNALLLQFCHHVLQDVKHNQINYASRLKVDEIADFIRQNLDKDLSVNQLAAMANLSPDYLTFLFKSYTGYPLVKYINKCRIDTAKIQLEYEPKKIKEVARQLGFKDEFYFSRVFKQFEGISPYQFNRNTVTL